MTGALTCYSFVLTTVLVVPWLTPQPFSAWSSCDSVCKIVLAQDKHINSNTRSPPAWRVQPRNYLLFACHFTNASAQSINDARFIKYWYMGGREERLGIPPATKDGTPVMDAVVAAQDKSQKS